MPKQTPENRPLRLPTKLVAAPAIAFALYWALSLGIAGAADEPTVDPLIRPSAVLTGHEGTTAEPLAGSYANIFIGDAIELRQPGIQESAGPLSATVEITIDPTKFNAPVGADTAVITGTAFATPESQLNIAYASHSNLAFREIVAIIPLTQTEPVRLNLQVPPGTITYPIDPEKPNEFATEVAFPTAAGLTIQFIAADGTTVGEPANSFTLPIEYLNFLTAVEKPISQ
jgi:hypothetical protein